LEARRIARHLRARGAGEEPVALYFDGGPRAIAAMLGVLEAGAFYVPLDSSHPTARTREILWDSGARILLSDAANGARARERAGSGVEVAAVGALPDAPEAPASPHPDSRAFVMYTSGSTGRPKGVVQSHRNVLHKAMEHTNFLGVGREDRIALLYSLNLSGSVRHVFSALLNGATLLPFDVARRGLGELARWLAREEITIYGSAATVFRHLARTLEGRSLFPKLRVVHVGSETIHRADVELYRQRFSEGCAFVATFGSSEISPICRAVFDHAGELPEGRLPVGPPAAGVTVRLVGKDGHEAAAGETGEIVVESEHLFLGYWRRPDLDHAVLSGAAGGTRRFRTGDLGARRADGSLLHLGRLDFQVKIRGQRIETAEIERAILEVTGVVDAAVAALERPSGEADLVAYVVTGDGDAACVSRLRQRLNRDFPPSMLPASYVFLPELPRNAAGKLDRSSLPAPLGTAGAASRSLVPPSTLTEKRLAAIWSEVFGTEAIGMTDEFLDVGGHSLLALRIVARIFDTFAVTLEPREVFERPTIGAFAGHLDALRLAAEAACAPHDARGDSEEGVL
ncbi:MAG: non-ribosomal peptide synthetase, partial [Candidatus Binatia bacterium]